MLKLYYAPIDLGENDIILHECKQKRTLLDKLPMISSMDYEATIYLVAFDVKMVGDKSQLERSLIDTEIYITSCLHEAKTHVKNNLRDGMRQNRNIIVTTVYFQEYENYESAYAVALSMRENVPYCYNE